MKSIKERDRAVASEARTQVPRSRATAPKAERKDMGEKQWGVATRAVAKAKSAQIRRGAVETPPVQSVERALSLLEAVAGSADPVPLAQLTEVLGIDPSSVFRLANTLKRRGFLANPNGRKHYVLGPAVWRLSREYDWSRMLISICRESVKTLANAHRRDRPSRRQGRARGLVHRPPCLRKIRASSSPARPASGCRCTAPRTARRCSPTSGWRS